MSVPKKVREMLRARVWKAADDAMWDSITNADKANRYDQWTDDPQVGGVLGRYIDKGQVRVYLKDTLLKDYAQEKLADAARPLRVLRIPDTTEVASEHRKPHGRTLVDGRVICWGRADDWRLILLALHERTYCRKGLRPYAAVLMRAMGRFHDESFRDMVNDAGKKLGIEQLVWLDT